MEPESMYEDMPTRRKFLSDAFRMLKRLAVVTPIASFFCLGLSNGQTASQNDVTGKIPVDKKSYVQTTKGITDSAVGVYQEGGREITEEQKREMQDALERRMHDLLDKKGYKAPAPPTHLKVIN